MNEEEEEERRGVRRRNTARGQLAHLSPDEPAGPLRLLMLILSSHSFFLPLISNARL